MRTRIVLCWTAGVALSLVCNVSTAQTTTAPQDDRLDKLERRLNELEADVKSRDEEIVRLREQLEAGQAGRAGRGPAATATAPTQDDIDRTKQDVLRDL